MRLLLTRVAYLVPVLLLVSLLTMLMLDAAPGDPAHAVLGDTASPEQVKAVRDELHLDDPFVYRYTRWVGHAVTGDLGRSFRTKQPVMEAIRERLPVTIELALLAEILAILLAVPIALLCVRRPDGRIDRAWNVQSSVLISAPPFVAGLLLSFLLSVRFHVFPVTGWVPLTRDLSENLRCAVLPVLTLTFGEVAVFSRLLRADLLATLQEDFVLNAKAKGLSARYVLLRHALRPSSFSLLTLAGLSLGRLLGGTVVVETIFALPGLGTLVVQAILGHDLVVVQGVVILLASAYVLINAGVDALYRFLDPRVLARAGT